MPCPYANILGEPGKGIHEARLFGLARNDVIGTFFIAAITSYLIKPVDIYEIYKVVFSKTFLYALTSWFVLGEVLHYSFGTNTAFLRMIGMQRHC